jgi:hypothetical protein
MAFPNFISAPEAPIEPTPGLGGLPRREWPMVNFPVGQRPIDLMKPGSIKHNQVLQYLTERLSNSEHAMMKFRGRWRANERRNQAWIDLPKFEQILKDANDSGKPPKATNIVIPFTFATLSTISTYLLQVFTGRKPMHQVGTYGTAVENAQKMEVILQYQSDHTRLIRQLWQFFNDAGIYGVAAMRTRWRTETAMRTRRVNRSVLSLATGGMTQEAFREQQEAKIYEGNIVETQDPFMFFPDPRVPMLEVAEKGEYVFWRLFQGKHILKRAEAEGLLQWVDNAPQTVPHGTSGLMDSARAVLSGGEPHPGAEFNDPLIGKGNYKVDQCSIDIIPRELGIGHSERVEKWLFTILNSSQICQAERQLDDHDRHPVVVIEPTSMGYSFGGAAMSDYTAPIQDTMSWFVNAHMDNVRKVINDMLVFDPMLIEAKDLKNPEPGKLIRLKKTAYGTDVRQAIQQLDVQDVTRGHMTDMQAFMEIGQRISAVTDNLLGLQDSGGRKTATEVRTSAEGAASRLASLAKVISAQGMTELTYQMSLNTQQWLSEEFYVRVVGEDGRLFPLTIDPDGIAGDFYYPIHDGTLPLDRVALLDIWQQMFLGILKDPELRQSYSVPKIFEFIAELGGAKNIKSFRLQPMPQQQIEAGAQAGNLAPIPNATGPSGLTNAALPQPGRRQAGALQ